MTLRVEKCVCTRVYMRQHETVYNLVLSANIPNSKSIVKSGELKRKPILERGIYFSETS